MGLLVDSNTCIFPQRELAFLNKLPTMCCSSVLEALVGINSKSSRFVYPDVPTWLTSYSQWCRSCLASKKLKLRFVRVFFSCEIVSITSGPQVIPALSFERTKINFLLFNFVRFFHSPVGFFLKASKQMRDCCSYSGI